MFCCIKSLFWLHPVFALRKVVQCVLPYFCFLICEGATLYLERNTVEK